MSKYLPLDLFIRQALLYPLDSPFLPPENKVEEDYSYAAGKKIGSLEPPPLRGIPKTGQITKVYDGDDGDLKKGITREYEYEQNGEIDTEAKNICKDVVTGLVWIRDHTLVTGSEEGPGGNQNFSSYMGWEVGLTRCNAFVYDGKDDWRMPNIFELYSIILIEITHGTPYIDEDVFPNPYSGAYWSGTNYPGVDLNRLAVRFDVGDILGKHKSDNCRVRPVRGPD